MTEGKHMFPSPATLRARRITFNDTIHHLQINSADPLKTCSPLVLYHQGVNIYTTDNEDMNYEQVWSEAREAAVSSGRSFLEVT